MKLRIIESGMSKMCGHVGNILVTDGVTEDINQREADRLAGMMRCEIVDESGTLNTDHATFMSGSAPMVSTTYDPNKPDVIETNEGETNEGKKAAQIAAKMEDKSKLEAKLQTAEVVETPLMEGHYSREMLERIADQKGITGLREIAAPFEIKGTAIAGLIDGILDRQANQAAK